MGYAANLGGGFGRLRCLSKKLVVYVKVPEFQELRGHVLVVLVPADPVFEFAEVAYSSGERWSWRTTYSKVLSPCSVMLDLFGDDDMRASSIEAADM